MNSTRMLLICERGFARAAYVERVRGLGVEVDCIEEPDTLRHELSEVPYSGLLIDVPTMIRSESNAKGWLTGFMARFPVLRLVFDPRCGGIRGLNQDFAICDNADIADFVMDKCIRNAPVSVRKARRIELELGVELLDRADSVSARERTRTLNVSKQGCFVLSDHVWPVDKTMWIVVNEFEDKTPIGLKICWSRESRAASLVPGVGARFETLTERQYWQLCSLA
ncbi:PilZ domain-containing protein [Pseudodesulfovibrio tunisiensis]|uniref:PilZ domain-containing protein n=1 Tax=Pseudodesulfovibrio tunisiensis TaxID=463192 RepID=UPI001FB2614A|nr:PilZ domain-containing protein [Pseudodesulfovibrio tunisiensis]